MSGLARVWSMLMVLSFVFPLGCTVHTRNLCESDGIERIGTAVPRDCRHCVDNSECTFQGNGCEGVVFCAHREAALVSTDIGCSPEPDPPWNEGCICRDGYCQVR